jgi:hypothetical protein
LRHGFHGRLGEHYRHMLQDYLYQALELNPDGSVNLLCHEGKFQAFDLEPG